MRAKTFWAASLTHFFIDLLGSLRDLLLAYLSVSLLLSNSDIGFYSTLAVLMGSISQPLFGLWADRHRWHWLAPLGLFWMVGWYLLAGWLGGYPAIACLVIAALGSAAFHPVGAERARNSALGKIGLATGMFFLLGQIGSSFGPLAGGFLLEKLALRSLYVFSLLALPVALWSLRQLTAPIQAEIRAVVHHANKNGRVAHEHSLWELFLMIIFVFLRSAPNQAAVVFIPKLLVDRGLNPTLLGALSGVMMAGVAIGSLTAGWLSDHLGKRIILMSSLALAIPCLFLFPFVENNWLFGLLVFGTGFGSGASHPLVVNAVQDMFPKRQAMASGISLGLIFISGTMGAWLVGILADQWGLAEILRASAALFIPAILLVPLLFPAPALPATPALES